MCHERDFLALGMFLKCFLLFRIYIYEKLRESCLEGSTNSSKCKRKGNSNSTGNVKASTGIGDPYNEEERFNPSKTYNPGPLKLEIKSIKNSTRTDYLPVDMNNILNEGEGRAFITAAVLVSTIIFWSWKAFWAHIAVHGIDFLWSKLKNKLGFANDHYETLITVGHDHNHHHHHKGHHHHRNALHHSHGKGWTNTQVGPLSVAHRRHPHHHSHHDHHDHKPSKHHEGWPAPHHDVGHGGHHHDHRIVHKAPYLWYHPASKLFEQPTIQYSPHGKHYQLTGFDQHQAYKYRKKYNHKFGKYKRKYYRKKGKGIRKAQRQREKAARRKRKRERRKKKVEAFKDKLKDWFNIPENTDDDDGDDGDEEDDQRDNNWKETSSEMEHGKPPHSYYRPGQDYDPLPFAGKHQSHVRITKRSQ